MFRDAQPADRKEFLDLWADCLEEIEGLGGESVVDIDTMRAVRDLFDAYVSGDLAGVCVLYQPPGEPILGAAFCGEDWGKPTIPKGKFGRIAWGWGVYLKPLYRMERISYYLQENARKKLARLGFDTLCGEILLTNEASLAATKLAGWKPHAIVHVMRLEEFSNDLSR